MRLGVGGYKRWSMGADKRSEFREGEVCRSFK